MARLDELALRLADADLDDSEWAELIALLHASPNAEKELFSWLELEGHLRAARRSPSLPNEVVARIQDAARGRTVSGVLDLIRNGDPPDWQEPLGAERETTRAWSRAAVPLCGLAAATLLMMALQSDWVGYPGQQTAAVAAVTRAVGPVSVVRGSMTLSGSATDIRLQEGDVLATGSGAEATLRLLAAGSTLRLDPRSRVRVGGAAGPSAQIEEGTVSFRSRINGEQLIAFGTPHGIVRVGGAHFTVTVGSQTEIQMRRGEAEWLPAGEKIPMRLVRTGRSGVESPASSIAIASSSNSSPVTVGSENPRRWIGININGPAVIRGGTVWWSWAEALSRGFKVEPYLTISDSTALPLDPVPDNATREILTTGLWVVAQPLNFSVPVQNGRCEVWFWILENFSNRYRTLDVSMEGLKVAEGIGNLPLARWQRYGPYECQVVDGILDVEIRPTRGEPHLMGLEIEMPSW